MINLAWGCIGVEYLSANENRMETTIVYWGYIGVIYIYISISCISKLQASLNPEL